jgi:hypothetical protein
VQVRQKALGAFYDLNGADQLKAYTMICECLRRWVTAALSIDPLGVGEHLSGAVHDAPDGAVEVGLAERGGELAGAGAELCDLGLASGVLALEQRLKLGVVIGGQAPVEVVALDPAHPLGCRGQ